TCVFSCLAACYARCMLLAFVRSSLLCFFFTAPAPTEIYTLSLHDALPISRTSSSSRAAARRLRRGSSRRPSSRRRRSRCAGSRTDRKSTRLNSSHVKISYAVFCLKKKKKHNTQRRSEPTWQTHHIHIRRRT